ncbi:PP2C family protein-serine/threonine phosphatase [Streptomyces polygonati]|uniref:PP2C family protein-serine/threonine phosphatase n=1 Tax=Streptomyces polygonati TaxID=1617087 RepID=A0ABV8HHA1_9ACTN
MCATGDDASHAEPSSDAVAFSALLEDSVEDLYENAPCGYLSTLLDGQIAKVNTTLLDWLGYRREELVGRRRFADLLTVGGRIYHETHFAPLLSMQGEVGGIALELRAADGTRLPVLVTSVVKHGHQGRPLLIRTTVFDARDRRAYETELLRATQEARAAREAAEAARDQTERERARWQQLAVTLQRTLLPPTLTAPPGMRVAAHYRIASTEQVGGDFYDLFPLAGGSWGLFLGDVCGKGAEAAAITSLARYTLRAAAVYDPEPAAVVANLNTVLNFEYQGLMPRFCTVLFGVLTPDGPGRPDQAEGAPGAGGCAQAFTLTLAGGGHPPALLIRADASVEEVQLPGGQLIGALPDPYIATATVRLAPGDTLLLYTDGLTEARTAGPGRDRYGDEALLDFAAALAPSTAAGVVDAVTGLLDALGEGVEDDTAVLALSVPARTAGGSPDAVRTVHPTVAGAATGDPRHPAP